MFPTYRIEQDGLVRNTDLGEEGFGDEAHFFALVCADPTPPSPLVFAAPIRAHSALSRAQGLPGWDAVLQARLKNVDSGVEHEQRAEDERACLCCSELHVDCIGSDEKKISLGRDARVFGGRMPVRWISRTSPPAGTLLHVRFWRERVALVIAYISNRLRHGMSCGYATT